MTSLIRKPHQVEVPMYLKCLLYGHPGMGKSTLGVSAPRPLMIDTDGGVGRVHESHRVDTVQVKFYEEVLAVLEEDLSAYDSIVFDTGGKLIDLMSDYIIRQDARMGSGGQLKLQGYGVRKEMFKALLRKIETMGKHIFFIAHEVEDKDSDNKIVRPLIGGSSSADLIKELDLVGYMEAAGNVRTISFNPQQKFYAKNSCQLAPLYKIKDLFDKKGNPSSPNDFLTTEVVAKFDAMGNSFRDKQKEYAGVMDNIEASVASTTNAEELNKVVQEIAEFKNHMFDSKLQAKSRISEHAKKIGVKFNSTTKQYEPTEQPAAQS